MTSTSSSDEPIAMPEPGATLWPPRSRALLLIEKDGHLPGLVRGMQFDHHHRVLNRRRRFVRLRNPRFVRLLRRSALWPPHRHDNRRRRRERHSHPRRPRPPMPGNRRRPPNLHRLHPAPPRTAAEIRVCRAFQSTGGIAGSDCRISSSTDAPSPGSRFSKYRLSQLLVNALPIQPRRQNPPPGQQSNQPLMLPRDAAASASVVRGAFSAASSAPASTPSCARRSAVSACRDPGFRLAGSFL